MTKQLIRGIPEKDYHDHEYYGSTSMKAFADPEISLAEVHHLLNTNEYKPAYDFGALAHKTILEKQTHPDLHVVEAPDFRTKAAREERDEQRALGKIVLSRPEYEAFNSGMHHIQEAIQGNTVANDLLTDHNPEISVFWEDDGIGMKARIDALHEKEGIAVDLKTVRSARPNDFRKQISDLGYYIQAKHYLNGLKAVTGRDFDWYFVAVQKVAPFMVSVHKLEDVVLDEAQDRLEYAKRRIQQSKDGWPGYSSVFTQELTAWEAQKNEQLFENELVVSL